MEHKTLDLVKAQLKELWPDKKLISDDTDDLSVKRIELRLPSFNKVLSNRWCGPNSGLPVGKMIHIYGMESSGKSAFAFECASTMQELQQCVLWNDMEATFDSTYAFEAFGLLSEGNPLFVLAKPDFAEQAFDVTELFLKTGQIKLAVLDSVAALGTKKIFESTSEDISVAALARVISTHMIRATKLLDNTTIIYINQLRDNIINMGGMVKAMGKKYSGGNALHFYPHIALKFTKEEDKFSPDKSEYYGREITIESEKNKTAKPFIKVNLLMIPGEGFSREIDILNLAVKSGVVSKKGNWYYYGEQSVGNGQNQARLKLKEKPEFLEAIWDRTKVILEPRLLADTQALPENIIEVDGEFINTETSEVLAVDKPKRSRKPAVNVTTDSLQTIA